MAAGDAIGIFDSGVGGLTVLHALAEALPAERLVYLGDAGRHPYGTKSGETVARYSLENAEFLLEKGIKLLVVACNTASAVALDALRARCRVPVVGVIDPGARAAAARTRNQRVGVIAEVMGDGVALVDSAEETARAVAAELAAHGLARRDGTGSSSFFVTDVPDRFIRIGRRFLGTRIESAVRIERLA